MFHPIRSTAGNPVIAIDRLCKSFGDIHAVNDLSFAVEKGSLFAFLGVNGAGKSTTIAMLCGQLKKDSGSIRICGIDMDRHPAGIGAKIGVVFQNSVLDGPLSVRDNLQSRAALYGITGKAFDVRLNALCGLLALRPLLKRPLNKLSGGQRRRVDIARALVHQPEILILDEPTTGLDPQTRKMLWDVLGRLRKDGLTVFLTTHYMEEAADANRVIILDSGKIAAEGSPLELKNRYASDTIRLYGVDEEQVRRLCRPYEKLPDGFALTVENTARATSLILENPALFSDYEVTKGKMDDVFLAVTGKLLNGGNQA